MNGLLLAALTSAFLLACAGTLRAQTNAGAPQAEQAYALPPTDAARGAMALQAKLELSQEQAASFMTAMKFHHETMSQIDGKMKELMKTLRDQVAAKAPDPELLATLSSLADQHKARVESQLKLRDELAAVLTPTQQAKFLLGAARANAGMAAKRGRRGAGARRRRKK